MANKTSMLLAEYLVLRSGLEASHNVVYQILEMNK